MPADRDADPLPAAWSEVELLGEKDFADYTDAERAIARRLLIRLAARGHRRSSRRTRPARRRGEVHDLRATVRASLRYGGEPVERRWRAHVERPRPLVLVCDVSGSMEPYARMLLQYIQAALAAHRRVEAFAFGTRLTRITASSRAATPTALSSAPPRRSPTGRAAPGSATRWRSSTKSTAGAWAVERSS